MRCNAFHAFGEQVAGGPGADVAKTEYPDHPLAFVDHRQSADLQRFHVPYRFGGTRRGADSIKVLRQPFAHNVAVGHHADQAIILASRA